MGGQGFLRGNRGEFGVGTNFPNFRDSRFCWGNPHCSQFFQIFSAFHQIFWERGSRGEGDPPLLLILSFCACCGGGDCVLLGG